MRTHIVYVDLCPPVGVDWYNPFCRWLKRINTENDYYFKSNRKKGCFSSCVQTLKRNGLFSRSDKWSNVTIRLVENSDKSAAASKAAADLAGKIKQWLKNTQSINDENIKCMFESEVKNRE